MDQLIDVITNVTFVMVALGGGMSAVFLVWAGYLFMSAQGDPQKMAHAKGAVAGIVVGILLMGSAFIVPDTISSMVLEPSGGLALDTGPGIDCDGRLKSLLVVTRTVHNGELVNLMVSRVQTQNEECPADLWNPQALSSGTAGDCFTGTPAALVNNIPLPVGLRDGGGPTADARDVTSRSARNDILIYWDHPDNPPSDSGKCWVYIAGLRSWQTAS